MSYRKFLSSAENQWSFLDSDEKIYRNSDESFEDQNKKIPSKLIPEIFIKSHNDFELPKSHHHNDDFDKMQEEFMKQVLIICGIFLVFCIFCVLCGWLCTRKKRNRGCEACKF